jgi:hypothetical protein
MVGMIEQTEQAIIGALEAQFPNFEVEAIDEDVQSYNFRHPKAALVPILSDVAWGDSQVLSMERRPQNPAFDIMSFTHGLHGDPSAYEVLRGVEEAIERLEVPASQWHPGGTLLVQRQHFVASRQGPVYVYNTNVQLDQVT